MFIRFSTLFPVVALAAVAAAAPSALEARGDVCSNGIAQCCNSTQESTPTNLAVLSGLLGIVLPQITGLIGLTCSPITGVGAGIGAACTQQAVCCTNNQFNGLVNLGCSPINVNL